jgi:hypothetical protein
MGDETLTNTKSRGSDNARDCAETYPRPAACICAFFRSFARSSAER